MIPELEEYWTAELNEPVEILERDWWGGKDYVVRVGGQTVDVADDVEAAVKMLMRISMFPRGGER